MCAAVTGQQVCGCASEGRVGRCASQGLVRRHLLGYTGADLCSTKEGVAYPLGEKLHCNL